jgi:hypothetical protein
VYTSEEAARFSKKDIDDLYKRFSGYVNGALSLAENLSENTCEYCGEPGSLSTEGWWKTLCNKCRKPKTKPANE